MDLDRLQVTLRQRRISETLDLGLRIHQHWSGPVYRAWSATVLPAWIVILVATTPLDVPGLGPLIIWWLKPLWDRIPLFVISRAIFGATPTVREVLQRLPELWTRHLFIDLFWYRFSPCRSLLMPVTQLEGLHGGAARTRRHVLGRGGELGGAVVLILAGTALELTLTIGLFSLGIMMMPDIPGYELTTLIDAMDAMTAPLWIDFLPELSWLAALSLVEPVYVASGFALYLNRRTVLEGWDIELSFRRLAARVAKHSTTFVALFVAAFLSGSPSAHAGGPLTPGQSIPVQSDSIVSLNPISDLVADEDIRPDLHPGPSEADSRRVEKAAEAVFARSEFGSEKQVVTWVPRADPTFAGMDLTPFVAWMEGLMSLDLSRWLAEWFDTTPRAEDETDTETERGWFSNGLSRFFEILAWATVAALAISGLMFLYNRRTLGPSARDASPDVPKRSVVMIGAIRGPPAIQPPEVTIPARVWSTWTGGEPDQALAMLYNAALDWLASHRDLERDPAWTERDYSRLVRSTVGGAPARYFQRVVQARTRISYAHRRPEDGEVRALCDDWSQLGGDA